MIFCFWVSSHSLLLCDFSPLFSFGFLLFIYLFIDLAFAGKFYSYEGNLSPLLWSRSPNWRSSGFNGRLGEEMIRGGVSSGGLNTGHCGTVERLYAWEKKLHQEVKVLNLLSLGLFG